MHIQNIDLHYHAGQERHSGTTVRDYLEHAWVTGRKILGVTDHFGKYLKPDEEQGDSNYPPTIQGLKEFRDEVEVMKRDFPDIRIFFGPEISLKQIKDIKDEVNTLSDFYIGSPPSIDMEEDVDGNTRRFCAGIIDYADLRDRTGKPVFIAHPFRSVINSRLVKADRPAQWITELEPDPDGSFPQKTVGRFFKLDLREVARVAEQNDIPLEINGDTHYRLRGSNLYPVQKLLWEAYRIMRDTGAQFVPASDLHGYLRFYSSSVGRIGAYVPADCFEALGISVEDLGVVSQLLSEEK